MLGDSIRASRVLSGWGLETGEDVGAIVRGCVDAGWLKPGRGDSPDDFREMEIPDVASRKGPSSKCRLSRNCSTARRRRPLDRPPTKARKLRRVLIVLCRGVCGGFCLAAVALLTYVLWAERLSPEERP